MKLFEDYKKAIEMELENFFNTKVKALSLINRWGEDSIMRLREFMKGGKKLRGSLLLFSEEMFKNSYSPEAVNLALSLEFFQSAFLIHDDIIDKDIKRRGLNTIFYQYVEIFREKKLPSYYHLGEGMGICVGDLCLFLGFENISKLNLDAEKLRLILRLISNELSMVCLGQMEDTFLSSCDEDFSENHIISTYLYKTARYTFALPLVLGSIIAGVEKNITKKLETIGENLGIIFQIKDDEIGIFGSESQTGKPVGSDIKENKKTLHYFYLNQLASDKDRKKIKKIYGREKIRLKDLELIKNLIKSYGVDKIIKEKILTLTSIIKNEIETLPVSESHKENLFSFIEYNITRSS